MNGSVLSMLSLAHGPAPALAAAASPLQPALFLTLEIGAVLAIVGMMLCLYRMVRGPHLADRVLSGDTLVLGADGGGGTDARPAFIHALDRRTGRERWRYQVGPGAAGAIVGAGALAFAATLDGRVLALEVQSGSLRWSFPVRFWGWEGPTVREGLVYAGGRDGTLSALDAESGQVRWQAAVGSGISTSAVALPSGLYLGTADGRLHRVDAASGKPLASLQVDTVLRPRGVPVPEGDSLLVLLGDRRGVPVALVSVDLALMRVAWRQAGTAPWSTARVFVSGGAALVGTEAGGVHAYCLATGAHAWSRDVGGLVRSIGGTDDHVYVGTSEGVLRAFPAVRACGR